MTSCAFSSSTCGDKLVVGLFLEVKAVSSLRFWAAFLDVGSEKLPTAGGTAAGRSRTQLQVSWEFCRFPESSRQGHTGVQPMYGFSEELYNLS